MDKNSPQASSLFLTCLFLFSLLFLTPVSYAGTTLDDITKEAHNGDKIAQYQLAIAYDSGDEIEQDQEKAVYWYTKSAEQGYDEAQYNLAISYTDGEGIKSNKKKALFWYMKAAKQGHPEAQNNLGVMYETGEGTPIDMKQALFWYTQSAQNKSVLGQYNLAEIYAMGRSSITPDLVQAYAWYAVAQTNGDEDAPFKLMTVHDKITSQTDRNRAEKLAKDYIKKYAK